MGKKKRLEAVKATHGIWKAREEARKEAETILNALNDHIKWAGNSVREQESHRWQFLNLLTNYVESKGKELYPKGGN